MSDYRLYEFTKRPTLFLGFFLSTAFLSVALPTANAFDAVLETVPTQYEVVTIQNPETQQLILGELEGDPEMFEIVSETPFTLTAEIRAIPDMAATVPPPLSGIIIKQKEIRGVEEIARLNALDADWTVVSDQSTGLKYQAGGYYSAQVEPGTYRIEVSSPNNQGKYLLMVGAIEDENGYFASVADIRMVYDFYDLSAVRMFSSPYIHYPIGIFVLLLLIAGTWYWQRNQKNHA